MNVPDDQLGSERLGGKSGRRPRHAAPRRRRTYWIPIISGLVLIGAVIGWQLNATLWTNHSHREGESLINQERAAINQQRASRASAQAAATPLGACTSAPKTDGPHGLLEVSRINLVAPVLEGTDDPQLNVAVGHDPNSVWPGSAGNAVLLAHDVSYFVNIDRLKPGDIVRYETACDVYSFRVQSFVVVKAGAPVYNTPGPTLTLVTCWPTNALWFTPDRYLVTAIEIAKNGIGAKTS